MDEIFYLLQVLTLFLFLILYYLIYKSFPCFSSYKIKNKGMEHTYFFAVDLGATSGRTILGLSLIHIFSDFPLSH